MHRPQLQQRNSTLICAHASGGIVTDPDRVQDCTQNDTSSDRRTGAMTAAALAFALAAASVGAQQTSPGEARDTASSTERSVEEIIVTAQRREERAQDVPIVISAFSSERLDQLDINEPQDLYGTVPSLVVGNQGTSSRQSQSFTIRGQATAYQSSPAVQIYLDEVPLISSMALGLQGGPGLMVDLENIQVLSGPQGTLFGRNTTGGAVLYVPRKPTNRFEGYVEGGVGNLDLVTMEGALNIPVVSDKLLVRIVGAYQSRRGYTRDLVWNKWRDDVDWYSGRMGITFKPTDQFENYLMLFGSESSTNGAGFIHKGFNIEGLKSINYGAPTPFCLDPDDVIPDPYGTSMSCDVYREQTEIAKGIGPRRTRLSLDAYSDIATWGGVNTTSYELTGELTLRNIISFQRQRVNAAYDQDGTPLQQYDKVSNADLPDFPIEGENFQLPVLSPVYLNGASINEPRGHRQLTEELQLQGNLLDDRLQFTVGAFYLKDETVGAGQSAGVTYCPALFTGLCDPDISDDEIVTSTSRALYAQGSLDLGVLSSRAERLRLTAGYRYTWDDSEGLVGLAFADTVKLKFEAPTWTLGLDYRPINNLLVYSKVSRGYKAGGINTSAVYPETLTFQPEELTTFEAGFKSDWYLGDVPFRVNAAYYLSDYENIHRPTADFNPESGVAGAQILGAEAEIQGFELETSIRPLEGVHLGAMVSYTDADYKKFDFTVPANRVSLYPACNGLISAGGVADLSCNPFQFTSKWIYNLYGSVDFPIPERLGELSLYLSYAHVSEQKTAVGNEPGSMLEAHGLLNGSITWRDIGRTGIDLTVFGNNLTDELYRVSNSNVFDEGQLLSWSTLYGEPRTYGLKLKYDFGQAR